MSVYRYPRTLFLLCCFSLLIACGNSGKQQPASELDNPELREQLQGSSGADNAHPGGSLYEQHCADCHDSGLARAPAKNLLQFLSPDSVLASLNSGVMQQQAATLSDQEKIQIVEFLVGKPGGEKPTVKMCDTSEWFDWDDKPMAQCWGLDYQNTRFVPTEKGKITAEDMPSLELKWVFDYPRSNRARSHPSFAGGAVFVGSQTGEVYALDKKLGCAHWIFQASAEVRTGITIPAWQGGSNKAVGVFADILARIYAIDLTNGTLLWSQKADDHPNATTTAQAVVFDGLVFQPVSSLEVVPAADPEYACCTFRGSIVTLSLDGGTILRKTYTIPEEPTQVATNNIGTPVLAPSGAPVWNTPTLDTQKRRLYFGTGENYSSPADGNSDAIIAMDIDDGSIAWVAQTTSRDAWNLACMPFIENQTNCPVEKGPDVDYGAPPILVEQDNKSLLVAGQKSGEIFGINPDNGDIVWQQKVGRGGNQGGMHFGMAAEGTTIYVPISDYTDASLSLEDARPGIYALDAFTGEYLWQHPAENVCGDLEDCDPGISAAISAVEGAAIAGHMDGWLRVYNKSDGELVWEFDTNQEFQSLSGRAASGGSFGGGTAPVVSDGMLYANSGYGLYFHMPGNVLLAFGPKD